jgi:hypothetical protein
MPRARSYYVEDTEVDADRDALVLRWVPLSMAARWDKNPKEHDVGGLIRSIQQYGFKDPPKFEPTLNGGDGGIVEGNGRHSTLQLMESQNYERPRGVAEVKETKEWAVQILFGVDAESQAVAEAYALDHNNLTLLGGDFEAEDIQRMYDLEGYAAVAKDLAEADVFPVSLDGDDIDDLLLRVRNLGESEFLDDLAEQEVTHLDPEGNETPYVNLAFPSTVAQRDRILEILTQTREQFDIVSSTEALLYIAEYFADNELT